MPDLTFIRSSRCETHACLEVAFRSANYEVDATPEQVYVRDSKDLTVPPIRFTPDAWRAFTAAIKADDL